MDKNNLDRMRELAGVTPVVAADPTADQSRNNMYQINESLRVVNEDSHGECDGDCDGECKCDKSGHPGSDSPHDADLEEAAKPDFADIDDDGDKDETAKKAAKDAEMKTESQMMREWAASVYEAVDDDEELDEADKPDFLDVDKDGDKEESFKKAAKDKPVSEQEQMREWSNSVYKNYEDKGHVMDQPEGETVDNSLRRYLNAKPSKVTVSETHTPKTLSESYKKFKNTK
jgi:hypothetical protein